MTQCTMHVRNSALPLSSYQSRKPTTEAPATHHTHLVSSLENSARRNHHPRQRSLTPTAPWAPQRAVEEDWDLSFERWYDTVRESLELAQDGHALLDG
ncbi:hypothetical protein PSPO01_02309 [Paraphaeosphaeria sporulosa]